MRSFTFLRSARFAILLPFALTPAACGDADTGTPGSSGSLGDGGAAVAPDTTSPTVVASYPTPGALSAPTAGEITVAFSEDMAAFPAMTFTLKQGTTPVAGSVTQFADSATFLPTSALAIDTTYTATVSTAAHDVAGNALASTHTWSFKTDSTAAIGPAPVLLGAAGRFVILAKSAISNAPTSAVTGDLGLSPAAASYITGLSMTRAGTKWTASQVIGSIFAADNDPPTPINLTTAVSNMEAAYTDAAGRPTPQFLDLGAGSIGGRTLTPGLYRWNSTVTIPTDVTISGAANDVWIFQITGDLMMSSAKRMTLANGARPKNIFWQVAGSVSLGTTSHSEGVILSKTAITLSTGASINGRLLAQTAVNIAGSTVTAPAP